MPGSRFCRTLLVLAITAASAGVGEAQHFGRNKVRYESFDFRILQTEHFDVYYYPEEERGVLQLARLAERWYERLSRALSHELSKRQALVLYESHPHFSQTNVIRGVPGETTGGFTESRRNRIVMPFRAGFAETAQVLGHELVHAFQYDIARAHDSSLVLLPLWFIEGMAEYLTVDGEDALTTAWMRDAVRRKEVPSLKDLAHPRYFPYRYGQAFWTFLSEQQGQAVAGKALKARGKGSVARQLQAATGMDLAALDEKWQAWLRTRYAAAGKPEDDGRPLRAVVTERTAGGRINLGGVLSPNGRRVIFFSERDRLSMDLYVADARTGDIERKLLSTATDPNLEALQYVDSAGAWDPEGHRYAFTAVSKGEPALVIIDVERGEIAQQIALADLGQAFNPSWSPDGRRIVFSALDGGLSDLYVCDLRTGALDRLTSDAFTDLQPVWSPDGSRVAFVTDRFTADVPALRFGEYRLAVLDLATRQLRPLSSAGGQRHYNPQWSSDGSAIFFLSDEGRAISLCRLDLPNGDVYRITEGVEGIGGVGRLSPGLSVASAAPAMVVTRFRNNAYEIHRLDMSPTLGTRIESVPALPPASAAPLAAADQSHAATLTVKRYQSSLSLNSIGQPYVSGGSGALGGFFRGGLSFSFSDMLGDRTVDTAVQAGTRVHDLAARVVYLDRRSRWNRGVALDFVPVMFGTSSVQPRVVNGSARIERQLDLRRQLHQGISGLVVYPFNRSTRLELSAGVRRMSFSNEVRTRVTARIGGDVISDTVEDAGGADPVLLGEGSLALVHDTAVLGPTSPLLGTRSRFEISPSVGDLSFTTVSADYRRYLMPVRPFGLAFRVRHVGRYGGGAADPRLIPLVVGLRREVRGYNVREIHREECRTSGESCSVFDVMAGSRLLQANLELRMPIPGVLRGKLDYGPLPMEAIVFADSGMLWTRRQAGEEGWNRALLRSVGAGLRVNAGGMVFEVAAVRPFDRPEKGWTLSFNLWPGF